MLDQFYSYLAEKISNFFILNNINGGEKFNIQFEKEEQVQALYNELGKNVNKYKFEYKDSNDIIKYNSYELEFGKSRLIVAATIDNVQPDFLTRLRNMVGVEKGYEKKAILFIHNTTLDSIIGGTESFSKEGMPLNIKTIQSDIKDKINKSNFSEVDKLIIELDIEKKNNLISDENQSVFEYRDLLTTINGSYINKDQYKNFGLFYDSKIKDFNTSKEIKARLKENALNFERVSEIHNYGNPDSQLERYFDDKGVDLLKDSDWANKDFKDIKKSLENKKDTKPLEYLYCTESWDRAEGTSKVKSRIRNVIVFNTDKKDKVSVDFIFDDIIYKSNIKVDIGEVEVATSGKKIKVNLIYNKNNNFYKIIYKNEKGIKFEFRIIMVDFDESYIENVKTKFSIVVAKKKSYILINSNENQIIFNEFNSKESVYTINDNYDEVEIPKDEKVVLKISDNFNYENDNDLIKFDLKIKESSIPFGMRGVLEKTPPIEGMKVWKLKREKKYDFKIIGKNKLQQGTKEYFTRDEFRNNLELEKEIIDLEGLYFEDTEEGLRSVIIDLPENVEKSYLDILNHYKLLNKVPSLTYLDENLQQLYKVFIREFINELDLIIDGSYLTKKQKNLFNIGVIRRLFGDREILLTPLHPINMVYQLNLNKELGDEELNEDILKRFSSTYLLPYITDDDDELFIPIEQYNSPEWKVYVSEKLPRYKSSRNFVSKLVTEKIEEFIGHFKYLFNMSNKSPIKISLINTGDSKEILQGIFKYYIKQLKVNKQEIYPIDVYIYSDKNITNAFEEVAFNNNIDVLKNNYGLDLNVDDMSEEDVLDLYREKVQFYSKSITDELEYSHISFVEMNSDIKSIFSNMNEIPSGVILDGMISGVPSIFMGDEYRTGFGTKYSNSDSTLMLIASRLNALNSAKSGAPYHKNQCTAISLPNKNKNTLDRIYDASHWITFIDPKVDLNFFKNDPDAKDLLIIHYSDQYTTAGGYDAITVTRKSGPYQKVIEEFLDDKGVYDVKRHSAQIINMFNAINGDWLLRLLSSKSHMPKEKISILSAIKLAIAKFKTEGVIWVPISLEEVLRVSGGAGLKQSEGLLSAKNLGFDKGSTSDDILLVGIENINDKVVVHYYPIEVKIGENSSNYIAKGIEQAKKTKEIFNEILLPNCDNKLTGMQNVYRNFLMQLIITSAEKLNLYDVCKEENWNSIIDSDLRRKLLNEEYVIKNSFMDSMGEAAVISFKKENNLDSEELKDNVMVIELSQDDGFKLITKTVSEIREEKGIIQIKKPEVNVELDNIIKEDKGPIYEYLPNEVNDRSMEIVFGINEKNNKQILWCPNNTDKVLHTNTGIIGTMGTGKTQFTKSMITQIYREDKYNVESKKVGILIFDYKGDYNKSKQDFIEATDAKVYDLYHLPFNPLSIIKTPNSKPMLPLHIANALKETLSKAFGLGIKQETLLRDLIMEAYEKKGIIRSDKGTWDKPAPTFKDVYDIYVNKDDLNKDSLYAAFSNLVDFEIFEPDSLQTKSLFDLIDGVTVIDLSGYDNGIQNLVVAITLDLFYSQMQAYGHSKIEGKLRQVNKIILVDEADNFLSKDFISLKKILKEGREFGVGTILSTQLLSHFSTSENDYSDYILTWVIHNVSDLSNKDVKYIFNTKTKQEEDIIFSKIKNLSKHHSIVKMGDIDKAIQMKDLAFWELDK